MVQIAGTYQNVKSENFVEYMVALGIPEEHAKTQNSLKPKLEVLVDGKKITLNNDNGADKISSVFILGEEVDEHISGFTLKSKATLAGNTLTVKSAGPEGKKITRTYEFSESELVVIMSNDAGGPTGKRFYKRV